MVLCLHKYDLNKCNCENQTLIPKCSYTFTEASEALGSGPLLIQHGINLIQRVRKLAESLYGD